MSLTTARMYACTFLLNINDDNITDLQELFRTNKLTFLKSSRCRLIDPCYEASSIGPLGSENLRHSK